MAGEVILWPGNFTGFTKQGADGNTVEDEAQIYLLNELLHEMSERLLEITDASVDTAALASLAVTKPKLAAALYTEGSYTITGTGFSSNPTGTARYVVFGEKFVILEIPGLSGTSNATSFTLTGQPAAIAPARAGEVPCHIENSSTSAYGDIILGAGSTTFTMSRGIVSPTTSWTNTSAKRIYPITITYLVA